MSRMPIRFRDRSLWPPEDASRRTHAVLVRISPGYPTETGRLHTRYSPVRRSPAEESKLPSPLPLDLHVLGLSLAFILSQDQTLRCMYLVFVFSVVFTAPCGSPEIHSPRQARSVSDPDRYIALGCRIDKETSCHIPYIYYIRDDPFSCTTCLL